MEIELPRGLPGSIRLFQYEYIVDLAQASLVVEL